MFNLSISTCGNPDHGQDPDRPLYGTPEELKVTASTLVELIRQVRQFQVEYDVGGGNWMNPQVFKNRKPIGWMSYNGRIWSEQTWTPTIEYKDE